MAEAVLNRDKPDYDRLEIQNRINKGRRRKRLDVGMKRTVMTIVVLIILGIFLMPLVYGISMAFKTDAQIAALNPSILPQSPATTVINGKEYELLVVPMPDGTTRELAIDQKGRESSTFIDPAAPQAPTIEWQGRWRTLTPVWTFDPQLTNFVNAWTSIDFLKLLRNTFVYALVTTFATVFSSSLVAYGFARFKFPGKGIAFLIIMATIILPPAVTLIPTYTFFYRIGWVGTWLPLIVPTFFANAYNVFLLRQFIMGIPRELDEAAKIDGAGPIRTFYQIIIPQALPGIIAVCLFHFFFAWNDFFGPLIYLAGKPDLQPITVGLTAFNNLYTQQSNLIQAASLISSAIPFIVFFMAQRFFMQGVVVTGVEK